MTPNEPASGGAPTPAEWKILRIIHESAPCPARDVVAVAGEAYGWSASTVKTLLRRLVAKGHLTTERKRNLFVYSPTQSAVRMICSEADGLLANTVDDAVGPLLAYMLQKSRLSKSDLDELRSLLDDKEAQQ